MISNAQQIANKQNALLGGVKTEEGKEISKFNAQKHAVLRETISSYEQELYGYIFEQFVEELNPEGLVEEILVERIAICYVKLFRVAKAEKEYLKAVIDPPHKINSRWDPPAFPDTDAQWVGYNPKINETNIERMSNIYGRYETTIENKMFRSLHELERLQRMRKGDIVAAPVAVDLRVEKMGSFSDNA